MSGGIRAKLFRGFAAQTAIALAVVLALVLALDLRRLDQEQRRMENAIRVDLLAKGERLCRNHGMVLRPLAEELYVLPAGERAD